MVTQIRKSLVLLFLIFLGLSSKNAYAQYCTPSFYYPCYYSYMYISSFSTTGGSTNITNNGSGCGNTSTGYTFYNTRTHTGIQGQTVGFSLTNTPYYGMNYKIWVDFNRDNDFVDAGENVYTGTLSYSGTVTSSFTIPISATPGTSRMRVRAGYQYSTAPAPCGMEYYGEAEDYVFEIVAACSTLFTQQPSPNSFACENGPGTISVNASNGAAYQWQILSGSTFTDLSNGGIYSGTNTKTLSLSNTPVSMLGKKFRCLVTPTCGSTIRNSSDTIALQMKPNITLKSQTFTDTSCIGINTLLTYKADAAITSSKWQIYNNNLNQYVDITGAPFVTTDDTLLVMNTPDTLNGARIRCVFTGICGKDSTQDIVMSVNALPSIITDPADQFALPGENVVFQAVSAGIGVKYQWQVGYQGSFANVNNNGIYSGVKTDRLYITGVSRAQNEFQFRCIVSGSGTCAVTPDTSDFGVLYVEPAVSVKDIVTDNSVTIFPNPAKGSEIIIKTEEAMSGYLSKYAITDKVGRTISIGNLVSTGNATAVNISKLSPDVYFIQVMDKENVVIKSVKFTRL